MKIVALLYTVVTACAVEVIEGMHPNRVNRENASHSTFISAHGLTKDKDGKYMCPVQRLLTHICDNVTHLKRDHLFVDFMLAFQGQEAQKWHQDGSFCGAGFVVYLTESQATEFAQYEGKAFLRINVLGAKQKFLVGAWRAAAKADEPFVAESQKPQSAGIMKAGQILCTHTAHVHRAPKPPSDGMRRTIFVGYETETTHCDLLVVDKDNYEHQFKVDRRGKLSKLLKSQKFQDKI